MKYIILSLLLACTIVAQAQVNRHGDANIAVRHDTVPKALLTTRVFTDTTIVLHLTTGKLDALRKNNVNLSGTASELMEKYEPAPAPPPQQAGRKVIRVEPSGRDVILHFDDGTKETVSTQLKDPKSDTGVTIDFPAAPSPGAMQDYANAVNRELKNTLTKMLSAADWNTYQNQETTLRLNVYGQIYARIQLLTYLTRK